VRVGRDRGEAADGLIIADGSAAMGGGAAAASSATSTRAAGGCGAATSRGRGGAVRGGRVRVEAARSAVAGGSSAQ
jgi:hypothetical protein